MLSETLQKELQINLRAIGNTHCVRRTPSSHLEVLFHTNHCDVK